VSEQVRQWDERVAETAEFIGSLLEDVAEEQNPIRFIVWLDTRASA
jgi:hypothetical protein